MTTTDSRTRIVILGGGFGGVYTARALEHAWGASGVHVTLVSRDNYFLMTPLLFEAGSGILEPRHAVNPIRPLFKHVNFVEAEVEAIDLDARRVTVNPARDERFDISYDHLVLALGGVTNRAIVPGSQHAHAFKTLGDAIYLRNHVIGLLEQADVERDAARKQVQLTIVVVGGGLVAVELVGELTVFLRNAARLYPHVRYEEVRIELLEAGPHIAPEFDATLAEYAARTLTQRGVRVRANTKVTSIERGLVHLPGGETIAAETIIIATGVAPSPLVAHLPIERDRHGRALVEPTLRAKGRGDLWGLGDCASIPDPSGRPYPPLAQHALREARCLADNLTALLRGNPLRPFVYETRGTLAALGHFKGAGIVYGIRIHGFLAWWVWRTYYLFQMPRWSRRLRIVIDWTIALFFSNDIVKLDFSEEDSPYVRDRCRPRPEPPLEHTAAERRG